MAQPQVHKSRRHNNPMLTHNGRPKYKAFTVKQLEEALQKTESTGKKRAKIVKELNRKIKLLQDSIKQFKGLYKALAK